MLWLSSSFRFINFLKKSNSYHIQEWRECYICMFVEVKELNGVIAAFAGGPKGYNILGVATYS